MHCGRRLVLSNMISSMWKITLEKCQTERENLDNKEHAHLKNLLDLESALAECEEALEPFKDKEEN